MKGEHTSTGEAPVEPRMTSDTVASRTRPGRRNSAQGNSATRAVRFFLSKGDSSGVPSLDRELANESEAIVESLKTGKTYFVVSEWKGSADLSKKIPLIRKEVVSYKKENDKAAVPSA